MPDTAAAYMPVCWADVPPLPPAPSNYTWMYDQNFAIRSYSFSNLDYVRTPDLLLQLCSFACMDVLGDQL